MPLRLDRDGSAAQPPLAAAGQPLVFATPDRHVGRALGGQNVPVYLRDLARAGARIVTDRALVGIRREGNRLVASMRHAYSREIGEEVADAVVADLGTVSSTELFDELVPEARNLGEVDHDALIAVHPQPTDANPDGRFALFRIGDALAPRDIHAALLDANRLCRAI